MAGREPGAFLKTASPVKSLLFVMCGCQSQSCQGWRLGGSGEVADSWQRLSEMAPAPALLAGPPAYPGRGWCGASPQHPMQTLEGKAPVLRQGEHPRLHPTCTPRGPGWGGGQGLLPLPSPSKALPPLPLQPAPLPTQGLSLTFPPEPYLINVTFSAYFYALSELDSLLLTCPAPPDACSPPGRSPTSFPLSPSAGLSVTRGAGGLPGAPQHLTGLQALQDLT